MVQSAPAAKPQAKIESFKFLAMRLQSAGGDAVVRVNQGVVGFAAQAALRNLRIDLLL